MIAKRIKQLEEESATLGSALENACAEIGKLRKEKATLREMLKRAAEEIRGHCESEGYNTWEAETIEEYLEDTAE